MTSPPLERDYDVDILEAQVAVDEEFETWLREFLGSRVKERRPDGATQGASAEPMTESAYG